MTGAFAQAVAPVFFITRFFAAIPISEHPIIASTASVTQYIPVSDSLCSVSEQHIDPIIQEVSKVLAAQGISCFHCPKTTYKLLPLSDDCWEVILPRNLDEKAIRFKLQICCGSDGVLYTFALTLSPADDSYSWRF